MNQRFRFLAGASAKGAFRRAMAGAAAARLPPVLTAMLALSACSILPARPPSPNLHDFGYNRNVATHDASVQTAVSVGAPEWLQTDYIRYRLLYADPTEVRFYSRDRWVAPPPALLAQRLSLNGVGQGCDLNVTLLEFEQIFDTPKSARAVLAFRAEAVRYGSDEPVAEKVFRFTLASPSADAKGAVTAFAELVERAVAALESWQEGLIPPK